MWIEREITSNLGRIAAEFPVVVVVGARQVGKTALLERAFTDRAYVTLDVGAHAEMAETRPAEFLRAHPPPVVVDEVQYAPAFFRHVKTAIDARRGENGLFILSGSQTFQLMEAVGDSLAGRAAVIPLLGLSGGEWQAAQPPDPDWRDFLWRGSYPGLWSRPEAPVDRDRWYQGYLASYLERDVRALLNVGSLRDFERFLRACAARTGQLLNMSGLGRDVGVSASTARNWISVLQASGVITLLEPYHRSLGKRLVKSPKLYLNDTGLAAFLMGFRTADALWQSPAAGALWETYVVGQWVRWRDWRHPAASLWFWQDRSANEVDLLIDVDGKLWPIECKLKEKPDRRDVRGVNRLRAMYGRDAIGTAYIACTTRQAYEVEADVMAVPGWTSREIGES